MAETRVSMRMDVPVERAFEVCSDIPAAADRIPDITALEPITDGPVGEGWRWRETRRMGKREATEEMWISAWDAPNKYVVTGESCGARFDTTFTFQEDGDGTRVDCHVKTTPVSLFAKLLSPFAGMMMKMMKDCMQRDLEALRAAAEDNASTTA